MTWGGLRAVAARRACGAVAATLTIVAVPLATAPPAAAHAELVSSTPSDGQELRAAPPHLLLRLSESVELPATKVSITDGNGTDVHPSSIELRRQPGADTEAPTTLVVGLPHLPHGQYRVAWTTLSSDDLHVTQGVLVFGVGERVRGAGLPAEPAPSRTESATRWAGLLGIGLALGSTVLLVLLGTGRRPLEMVVRRRLLTAGAVGALVATVAGALLPVAQALEATGPAPTTLRRLLLHESYGVWWWPHQLALVALVALALNLRVRVTSPFLRLGRRHLVSTGALAVVAVTTSVLMGHAGVRPGRNLTMVAAEVVHVTSALMWAGSVVAAAAVLSLRTSAAPGLRGLRVLVLQRFGLVALTCVAVATATGLLLAGHRIATPDALLHSAYGTTLLGKLLVAGAALALGGVNTLLLRPALLPRRVRPRDPQSLSRWTLAVEAAVVIGLLAVTATLSAAPPADGQRWQPAAEARGPVSAQADDLVEVLEVKPNRVGDNFLALRVFDTRRPSPGPVTTVTMTVVGPDARPATSVAVQKPDGSWVVAGRPLTAGDWRARAVVTRQGLPDATAGFHWTVPDAVGRQVTGWRGRSLAPLTRAASVGLLALLVVTGAAAIGIRRQRVAHLPAPREDSEEVAPQLSRANGAR